MNQWVKVKVPAAKPENPNPGPTPRTNMVEDRIDSYKLFCDIRRHAMTHVSSCTNK